MTLSCDPLDYADAGAALNSTTDTVEQARSRLLADLTDCYGMAGTDNAGEQFAVPYDELVESAFISFSRAEQATGQLGLLLNAAGLNYARADQPGVDIAFAGSAYQEGAREAIEVPPSALGSHEGEPWGWPLVSDAVGYVWPNGDTERLRVAARGWGLAAAGFETATFPISTAVTLIQAQNTPDGPLAVDACTELRDLLSGAAGLYRDLGTLCDQFAASLDGAREQAHELLEEFLWETALIGTISAAGSVFTAGAAAAGGASGFGANVVRYGAKIAEVLGALLESAGTVGRALVALAERVRQTIATFDAVIAARAQSVEAVAPWTGAVRDELARRLQSAERWTDGSLPTMGGPANGYLVKRDASGAVTNYSRYDGDGYALYRVDLSGRPHFDGTEYLDRPHTVDVVKNTNPSTGETFAKTSNSSTRPALPEEIPTP
ncbi:polymorphic toxin type 24 domain-containing protein [Actinomycetes bacterium M1A6_2h]